MCPRCEWCLSTPTCGVFYSGPHVLRLLSLFNVIAVVLLLDDSMQQWVDELLENALQQRDLLGVILCSGRRKNIKEIYAALRGFS